MIVRQVGTVAGTALKNAHIVLPNGTLRFGYGGCTQQVQVTCTGTDGNNKPNHWSISTISPHVGELVQTIGRTTQVVGYYYAPFQIDLVESTSTGSR